MTNAERMAQVQVRLAGDLAEAVKAFQFLMDDPQPGQAPRPRHVLTPKALTRIVTWSLERLHAEGLLTGCSLDDLRDVAGRYARINFREKRVVVDAEAIAGECVGPEAW